MAASKYTLPVWRVPGYAEKTLFSKLAKQHSQCSSRKRYH